MSNSTEKLAIDRIRKNDGSDWIVVRLLKYPPACFIPSFEDIGRIVYAIGVIEDRKYPPPLQGRHKVIDYLRDAVLIGDSATLARKYQIPERDRDAVVNTNGARLSMAKATQLSLRLEFQRPDERRSR